MREGVCVFGGLEAEWLRQRDQQVQRPGGAGPVLPEDQRAASVAGVVMERRWGERQAEEDRHCTWRPRIRMCD